MQFPPQGGYGYPPPGQPPPPYQGYPPAPQGPKSSGMGAVWIVAAIAMLLVFAGLIASIAVWVTHKRGPSGAKWSDLDSPVPVSSDDPIRGERSAPVTIVVFEDFQCPYCKKLESTLDDVRAHYGPTKVRIVWKNEPLAMHPNARPAAEAARGVFMLGGSDAFWTFHDQAYANQSSLDPAHYETWAKLSGVDGKKIRSGVTAHTWKTKIDDDHVLATSLGVTGTPMSYVNGQAVSGAQPLASFEKVIDAELIATAALLATGTKPDRVYVERSKLNFGTAAATATATIPPPVVTPPDTSVHVVPIGTSPTRGPATALVTIVEFSEFQCPYCQKVQPTLERLRTEYGTDLRFVWKNDPLAMHPNAEPAAEFALEARSQKGEAMFWIAHDDLFADQTHIANSDLLGLARRLRMNEPVTSTAILTKKYDKDIKADVALATSLGVTGTPTYFIDGRKLVGAQAYEKFKAMVDEEMVAAKAELAKGTSRANLYDTLCARGSVP